MTVADIERRARRILLDTEDPYRWQKDDIRDALQEGVYELNKIRPETRYVDGMLLDAIELPEDDDAKIDVENRFLEALVCFVVAKCYQTDDADTVNSNLSELYYSKFTAKAQL